MGIGVWGLGIGDWGLGPNPQSPIPNPHFINKENKIYYNYFLILNILYINNKGKFNYNALITKYYYIVYIIYQKKEKNRNRNLNRKFM